MKSGLGQLIGTELIQANISQPRRSGVFIVNFEHVIGDWVLRNLLHEIHVDFDTCQVIC